MSTVTTSSMCLFYIPLFPRPLSLNGRNMSGWILILYIILPYATYIKTAKAE